MPTSFDKTSAKSNIGFANAKIALNTLIIGCIKGVKMPTVLSNNSIAFSNSPVSTINRLNRLLSSLILSINLLFISASTSVVPAASACAFALLSNSSCCNLLAAANEFI